MANIGKHNAPSSVVDLLTTELNALTNNTASAASSAIANQTNLDLRADIWLHLASLTPTGAPYINVYILEAIDGSTYPSATGSVLRNQPQQLLCSFNLDTSTAAQDVVVRDVPLPPASFKVVLDNQSGVTLGATLNTLKMITYNQNLNG